MGSTFMTVAEASMRLSRSRRSIHYYMARGFLGKKKRGDKTLIPQADVEQLAIELGTDMPALNRRNMFDLLTRVKKLEEQISLVQAMWGLQEKPLRPSPKEASGLYKAVTDYLTASSYQVKELETWAILLNQVDEKTLEAIAEAAITTKPWEVFHQLADRMVRFVEGAKDLKSSLVLQALHSKLVAGKKQVRESALLWIESGRGTVPNQVFRHLDTPKEDLLRSFT